jgi:hypothetical protein
MGDGSINQKVINLVNVNSRMIYQVVCMLTNFMIRQYSIYYLASVLPLNGNLSIRLYFTNRYITIKSRCEIR